MSKSSESNVPAKRLLKAKLRSLAEIPIPDSLEQRLFDTIPSARPQGGSGCHSPVRRWQFMAVAAAVLLVGLVCIQNYGLSPSSRGPMVTSSHTGPRVGSADQNRVSVIDTNDANSLR